MTRALFIPLMMIAFGTSACADYEMGGSGARSSGTSATAIIKDANGNDMGKATAMAMGSDLMITVEAKSMPPGPRGIHVHMVGKCEGPAFQSAGAHWNPAGKQHGRDNPMGSHAGDIPNLEVGAKGSATLTYTIPGAAMMGASGLLDADGAAIVIHAKPDDYKTDPTGNSGDRIACGVFRADT